MTILGLFFCNYLTSMFISTSTVRLACFRGGFNDTGWVAIHHLMLKPVLGVLALCEPMLHVRFLFLFPQFHLALQPSPHQPGDPLPWSDCCGV